MNDRETPERRAQQFLALMPATAREIAEALGLNHVYAGEVLRKMKHRSLCYICGERPGARGQRPAIWAKGQPAFDAQESFEEDPDDIAQQHLSAADAVTERERGLTHAHCGARDWSVTALFGAPT